MLLNLTFPTLQVATFTAKWGKPQSQWGMHVELDLFLEDYMMPACLPVLCKDELALRR